MDGINQDSAAKSSRARTASNNTRDQSGSRIIEERNNGNIINSIKDKPNYDMQRKREKKDT